MNARSSTILLAISVSSLFCGVVAFAADLPYSNDYSPQRFKLRDLQQTVIPAYYGEAPPYGYGEIPVLAEARRIEFVIRDDGFGHLLVSRHESVRPLRRYGPEYYDYGQALVSYGWSPLGAYSPD